MEEPQIHLLAATYTRDVLPDELKHGDIVEYVANEIEWVRGQLLAGTGDEQQPGLVAAGAPLGDGAAHA